MLNITHVKTATVTDYFSTEHLKSGLRTRALKGATVSIFAQVTTFVLQTVGTIVLARLLSPDDFGLVTMVVSVSLLLQNFGVNGFTEAIIQKDTITHEQISTLFWINTCCSIVLTVLFIASSPIIVWFFKEPRLYPIIVSIAFTILLAGLSTQHLALLKRSMHFYKISANDIVCAVISTIFPIVLALWGWGYWSLVVKWLISPLAITVGAWIMCDWRPGLPARGTGVRPMLRFAFHAYGNFVMSYLRRNMDKLLIGRTFGSQPLGFYDRAYHLSNMLPVQIITPLYGVAVSTFSKLSDEPEKYRTNYLQVLSLLAFVGMPLSAVLTLCSQDVILFLLGSKWVKSSEIFFAFGISIGITITYITHGWLHLSLGTPDRWFRWGIIEFIVTAVCFLIGLPFGTLGVAFAFSASFYILLLPALWYAGRPIQLKVSSLVSVLWKYYVTASVSGLICWFIFHLYAFTANYFLTLNVLTRIIVSTVSCISLYLVLIVAVFGGIKPISQLRLVLQDVFVKKPQGV